jgi:hypothetical protein
MKKIFVIGCMILSILFVFSSLSSAKKHKRVLGSEVVVVEITKMVTVLPNMNVAVTWVLNNATMKIEENSKIKFFEWNAEEAKLGAPLMSLDAFEAESLMEELGLMVNGISVE